MSKPTADDVVSLRKGARLSQPQFARLISTSKQVVCLWESGRHQMHEGFWDLARARLLIRDGKLLEAVELLSTDLPPRKTR